MFGERAKQLREERGLTAAQVAEAVGIDTPTLWKIERGVSSPSMSKFLLMAEVLGVEPFDLLCFPGINVRHDMLEDTRLNPPAIIMEARRFIAETRRRDDQRAAARSRRPDGQEMTAPEPPKKRGPGRPRTRP
jgi:transcriptional regulator with XRE-family HTH domain